MLVHFPGHALKNWCFWTVVLEKTLESLLDSKKFKPVNPKGNQPLIFIGRTDAEVPIFWPPDAKSWFIGKDPDGKNRGQEEKRTTEDKTVVWHHWFNGHEFDQTSRSEGQEAWRAAVHGVSKSWTWVSDWTTTIIPSESALFRWLMLALCSLWPWPSLFIN